MKKIRFHKKIKKSLAMILALCLSIGVIPTVPMKTLKKAQAASKLVKVVWITNNVNQVQSPSTADVTYKKPSEMVGTSLRTDTIYCVKENVTISGSWNQAGLRVSSTAVLYIAKGCTLTVNRRTSHWEYRRRTAGDLSSKWYISYGYRRRYT